MNADSAETCRPTSWWWGAAVWPLVLAVGLSACTRPTGGEGQALLRRGDTAAVEARLNQAAEAHAAGHLSEAEWRQVYREFEGLDEPASQALDRWLADDPGSYQARLLKGAALLQQAWTVRGRDRAARLTADQASNSARLFRQADEQLSAALSLDPQPLMAAFYLMDALGAGCQRERMRQLLDETRLYSPYGALIHNRYQSFLGSRWCGTHAEMRAFADAERARGMPESGVLQLEAIEEDDRGQDWLDSRKPDQAAMHFKRALDRARQVGGRFQSDWLTYADPQRCRLPQLKSYCE